MELQQRFSGHLPGARHECGAGGSEMSGMSKTRGTVTSASSVYPEGVPTPKGTDSERELGGRSLDPEPTGLRLRFR